MIHAVPSLDTSRLRLRQLAMLVGHWAMRGYGMWAVEELGSGAFVGRVGLHYPEGWPEPEVAWAIALNLRSIRLAERLGERCERNLFVRGHEVSLYAIGRRHWRPDDQGGGRATSLLHG